MKTEINIPKAHPLDYVVGGLLLAFLLALGGLLAHVFCDVVR